MLALYGFTEAHYLLWDMDTGLLAARSLLKTVRLKEWLTTRFNKPRAQYYPVERQEMRQMWLSVTDFRYIYFRKKARKQRARLAGADGQA